MTSGTRRFAVKLLPALLALQGGAALAFETIKFDDGSTLDVSLKVNYVNMRRIQAPTTINDYVAELSDQATVAVTPGVKGTLWRPAVDKFTQWETRMNTDDGTNSVAKDGTISNRVSALMDIDYKKDNYRVFARVNAFRDQVLFEKKAGISPGTYNMDGPHDEYTEIAKKLAGQRTRLLDIYAQGRWYVGEEGNPLFVRVGRQVVNWGEGLIFQGIGSSMNPNDQIKGMTPGLPAAEAFLPTEQIYATYGVNEDLTLMAYKKWKFRPTEFAPAGTYWSAEDLMAPGGIMQTAFEWPAFFSDAQLEQLRQLFRGYPLEAYGGYRTPDVGKKNGGQWGLGLKYQWTDATDIGLYHLRYTETVPSTEFGYSTTYWRRNHGLVSGVKGVAGIPYDVSATLLTALNYLTPFPSTYYASYMNDIKLTGASFSTVVGDWQMSGEMAYRDGAPVMMGDHHYALARGRTVSANLSALRAWSGTSSLWSWTQADTVILGGELAVQHLTGYKKPDYAPMPDFGNRNLRFWPNAVLGNILSSVACANPGACSPHMSQVPPIDDYPMTDRTGVATAMRLELGYTPWPEWELSIPIFYFRQFTGMGASPGGWNSGLTGKGSSRMSVETKFSYRKNLELSFTMQRFMGEVDMRFHSFNPFADRDFIALGAGYNF